MPEMRAMIEGYGRSPQGRLKHEAHEAARKTKRTTTTYWQDGSDRCLMSLFPIMYHF